ncbi:uncharacterized protein TrAtP1_002296 [Trichoderma atroviride]|uniref:uncharacterized protein n=1 Tax=Hypocrea atroviridis TaxID=63577 RepID=UPI003330792D|nr:hypothetical protein TrAtP1_002296 [Trichoderma atroviride]
MYVCATAPGEQRVASLYRQALEALNKQWRLMETCQRHEAPAEYGKAKINSCLKGQSIDVATTASKHCPRSGPRLLQLVRAFLRLSLVQASNRLSSPVSVEQAPESGPSLVRNYRDYKGQRLQLRDRLP